jgi:hypothetical protein
MDSAGIIHRVLENKESLLNLHSVDGAPFYFTYIEYMLKTNQLANLERSILYMYSPYLWQQREPHIWSIETIVLQSCSLFPIVLFLSQASWKA